MTASSARSIAPSRPPPPAARSRTASSSSPSSAPNSTSRSASAGPSSGLGLARHEQPPARRPPPNVRVAATVSHQPVALNSPKPPSTAQQSTRPQQGRASTRTTRPTRPAPGHTANRRHPATSASARRPPSRHGGRTSVRHRRLHRIRDVNLAENPRQRNLLLAKLTQRRVQLPAVQPHTVHGNVTPRPSPRCEPNASQIQQRPLPRIPLIALGQGVADRPDMGTRALGSVSAVI